VINARIKRIIGGGPAVDFAAGFFATLGFFVASALWELLTRMF
jgi:hypothetical protein